MLVFVGLGCTLSRLLVAIVFAGLGRALQQQPLAGSESNYGSATSPWKLNFTSSAPHFFASTYGLLRQWPNTFFPLGHGIVPCEIPRFTELFHGHLDEGFPSSPEWLAFDVGMAYGIMGSSRNSHLLTYQTTRTVKCIYFDGESATLMGANRMDSQMLHIYGNVTGPPHNGRGFRGLVDEYLRADGLCKWLVQSKLGGAGWGFEGIIRMNAGFEMIWCNFSSPSLRLTSHVNVTAPLVPASSDMNVIETDFFPMERHEASTSSSYYPLPSPPPPSNHSLEPIGSPPPNWRHEGQEEPFLRSQGWEWFKSAAEVYGQSGLGPLRGETKAKIISCGIMSFYSPIFQHQHLKRSLGECKALNLTEDGFWTGPGERGNRTLALQKLSRRRRSHTLEHVTTEEAELMRSNSERVLASILNDTSADSAHCSGMDWHALTNDIVQQYAGGLLRYRNTIAMVRDIDTNNKTEVKRWLSYVRDHGHTFLVTSLRYPTATGTAEFHDIWKPGSALYQDTFSRCRFHYTRLLDPEEGIELSPEEQTLKWAVEETMTGICSVIVDVAFAVERQWAARYGYFEKALDANVPNLLEENAFWQEGLEELMAWLGWAGEYAKCERVCAWDEMCYIPMWPMIGRQKFGRPAPDYGPPMRPGDGQPHDPYSRPPYGYGGHGGGPGRRPGGGPRWEQDETDLWQPKCVKVDYIMWT